MKTYQIELRREAYVNFTVEANDQDEAEALAWEQLGGGDYACGEWDINSIEEVQNENI